MWCEKLVMVVQTYVAPGRLEPRVKASQCFTKYKWRDLDAAKRQSGPQIVATQVRSRPALEYCLIHRQRMALPAVEGILPCACAHIPSQ